MEPQAAGVVARPKERPQTAKQQLLDHIRKLDPKTLGVLGLGSWFFQQNPEKRYLITADAILVTEAHAELRKNLTARFRSFSPDERADVQTKVQQSEEAALSATAQPEEAVIPTTGKLVQRRKRTKSKDERDREAKIRRIIKHGRQGLKYCREMDDNGVMIPKLWILRGCPNKYVKAYTEGWEHPISNEKWRLKNRKP